MDMNLGDDGNWRVTRIAECRLSVQPWDWDFAHRNERDIARHWQLRLREHPGFFNGRVLMMIAASLTCAVPGRLEGSLFETDFCNFLYWRDKGFPDGAVLDSFGSAIIRSREGWVLLGRQKDGHINGGSAYPPGGLIDRRDISEVGTVDISSNICREVLEETGLSDNDLDARPGFWLTMGGAQVSIAMEFHSPLPAQQLRAVMLERIAADPDPELSDIVVVRSPADMESKTPDFARALVGAVLSER